MHLPPPEVHRTTCVWCARLASSQSVACSALWQLLCKALPAGAGMPSAALPPSPPAALQFFVKDMSGMVGGILFASTQGSGLDCYAKQWRLFADVMNDVGQWGCPGKVVLHAQWLIRKQVLHRLTGISTGPRTAAPHKLAAGSSCMVSFSLCARTYRSNGFCPAVPPDAFHLWATCAGMALELASPLLPGAFLLLACLGSVARAVTGVAGGATRMALTQHFARRRNAADIAAKEGSQARAAGLLPGWLLGAGRQRVWRHPPGRRAVGESRIFYGSTPPARHAWARERPFAARPISRCSAPSCSLLSGSGAAAPSPSPYNRRRPSRWWAWCWAWR